MIYEKNMCLLKQRYSDIYTRIKDITVDQSKYEIIKTKTGLPTLKIKTDIDSFFLHSKYNPIKEAETFACNNYDVNKFNYIVYGFGFNYHIQQLLKLAPNSNIYIIESNLEIFKCALQSVDLTTILTNSNIHIIVEDDTYKLTDSLKKILNKSSKKLIIYLPSLKAMPEKCKELKYLLEEFRIKEQSIYKFGKLMDDNFKENIKNYDNNVDVLFNRLKGLPAIIVSAGPSLDKNKHLLKLVKGKAIILAVGRTAKSLINIGVYPDSIIVSDAQKFVYDVQLKGLDIDIPLIVLSTCDKKVIQNYKGYKFIALQKGYDFAEDYAKENGRKLIKTGGSVATTALDAAINFGCNPIIFVGQDLAYTYGKLHSDSVSSKKIKVNNMLRTVKDINNNEIYTSKVLYSYLRWIEGRIRQEKHIKFIDATEGGAKILGTEIMELQNVIDKILINYNVFFQSVFNEVKNINEKY